LKYIYDYKENEGYRRSFSQLASATFGLDFESWYQHGFWDSNYICYSYVDGDQVIANVSVYKTYFIIHGKRKEGVQLVTGMTAPAYRKRELMGNLVKDLIHYYEKHTDFIYIVVVNKPMISFWLNLGFTVIDQKQFFIDRNALDKIKKDKQQYIQKLDMQKRDDIQTLFALAARRKPTSRNFYLENAQNTVMLYCLNEFRNNIYFFPGKDVVAIYKQEAGILHLYDLLFSRERCLSDILNVLVDERTREIVCYFTPEFDDIQIQNRSCEPETIFAVRPVIEIMENFMYPLLG
jgi:hypothetical protein